MGPVTVVLFVERESRPGQAGDGSFCVEVGFEVHEYLETKMVHHDATSQATPGKFWCLTIESKQELGSRTRCPVCAMYVYRDPYFVRVRWRGWRRQMSDGQMMSGESVVGVMGCGYEGGLGGVRKRCKTLQKLPSLAGPGSATLVLA